MFTWIELFNVSIKWKFTLCKCKLILRWKDIYFFLVTYAGLLQSFSLATRSHSAPSNDQPIYKTQSLPCILFFFSNQFPSDVCHDHKSLSILRWMLRCWSVLSLLTLISGSCWDSPWAECWRPAPLLKKSTVRSMSQHLVGGVTLQGHILLDCSSSTLLRIILFYIGFKGF